MPVSRPRDRNVRRIGRRVFYGWAVLGVAALAMFVSGPGQSHTFSVFVGPIGRDLGLSGTTIASAYGLATLVAAFCLPQMGRFLDRRGARRVLTLVAIFLGLACIAFGAATGVLWLTLGFAALRFLGQGSLMLCAANLVSQWFRRNRGFALSLMALGFSLSMAIHPPVSQWLIDVVGWRQAWLWIGISTWVLLLPPVWLLVVNRPEDAGLRPDGNVPLRLGDGPDYGAGRMEGARSPDIASPPTDAETGLTMRQALGTPAFYIISTGLFSLSMLVTSLHFFQVSIFSSHGLSAQIAAQVFTVSAFVMVLTIPLVGYMLDRFRTEWMFSGGLMIMVAALISATLVEDLWTAVAYAVVFGLNNAVTITFVAFMWPRYFGRRHLGSIQGTGQMIGVAGASLGPLPLGLAQDLFGGYNSMLLGLAAFPVCWAVIALFLRDPRPTAEGVR